ncbi:AAA family ATPase [Candidatus Phytoplasma meliae]|uniref:AAA family ATPase n=1 Tax=Candidatus Phytoplasma meliae TaxID=1848402 RepID=A0ABS5CXL8_9MOLU|nr:AAA family ATPase [Candidatus Phytoplasma meliae]MBP5835711.1 AAA family ATPase [Candidatus Phytoplasma meliae]
MLELIKQKSYKKVLKIVSFVVLTIITFLSLTFALIAYIHNVSNNANKFPIDSSPDNEPQSDTTNNTTNNKAGSLLNALTLPEINSEGFKGFHDVYGLKEVIQELTNVCHRFHPRNAQNYKNISSKNFLEYPKGVILYGPPGTGKTLLAKALAKESQMNFYTITPKHTLDEIEEIFKQARKGSPSLIFADEAEEIIKSRDDSTHLETGDAKKTDLLLAELDGVKTDEENPIYFVAATNHLAKIDTAIISRLQQVYVGYFPPEERLGYINKIINDIKKFKIEKYAQDYGLPKIMEQFNEALKKPEAYAKALKLNKDFCIPALGRKIIKGIDDDNNPHGNLEPLSDKLKRKEIEQEYERIHGPNTLPKDYDIETLETIKKYFYDIQSGRKLEAFIRDAATKAAYKGHQEIQLDDLQEVFRDYFGELEEYKTINESFIKRPSQTFAQTREGVNPNQQNIDEYEIQRNNCDQEAQQRQRSCDYVYDGSQNSQIIPQTYQQYLELVFRNIINYPNEYSFNSNSSEDLKIKRDTQLKRTQLFSYTEEPANLQFIIENARIFYKSLCELKNGQTIYINSLKNIINNEIPKEQDEKLSELIDNTIDALNDDSILNSNRISQNSTQDNKNYAKEQLKKLFQDPQLQHSQNDNTDTNTTINPIFKGEDLKAPSLNKKELINYMLEKNSESIQDIKKNNNTIIYLLNEIERKFGLFVFKTNYCSDEITNNLQEDIKRKATKLNTSLKNSFSKYQQDYNSIKEKLESYLNNLNKELESQKKDIENRYNNKGPQIIYLLDKNKLIEVLTKNIDNVVKNYIKEPFEKLNPSQTINNISENIVTNINDLTMKGNKEKFQEVIKTYYTNIAKYKAAQKQIRDYQNHYNQTKTKITQEQKNVETQIEQVRTLIMSKVKLINDYSMTQNYEDIYHNYSYILQIEKSINEKIEQELNECSRKYESEYGSLNDAINNMDSNIINSLKVATPKKLVNTANDILSQTQNSLNLDVYLRRLEQERNNTKQSVKNIHQKFEDIKQQYVKLVNKLKEQTESHGQEGYEEKTENYKQLQENFLTNILLSNNFILPSYYWFYNSKPRTFQ